MLPNIFESALNNFDEKSVRTGRSVVLLSQPEKVRIATRNWCKTPQTSQITEVLFCVTDFHIYRTVSCAICCLTQKKNEFFNLWLTSSDSLMSSVSSTCTTASAPHGIGAPVVTRITWPGITVWVGWKIKNQKLISFWKKKINSSCWKFMQVIYLKVQNSYLLHDSWYIMSNINRDNKLQFIPGFICMAAY